MTITLYTTDCPRCRDLKTLLDKKNITYDNGDYNEIFKKWCW